MSKSIAATAVVPVVKTIEELKAEQKVLAEQIKALKTSVVRAKKPAKGVMVSFTNQAGDLIQGLGVLYYVVRKDGKLHYKAADTVTLVVSES